VRIVAPLLWSGLYSYGSARGKSSTFHFGVSAACLLQLILSLYTPLDGAAAVATKAKETGQAPAPAPAAALAVEAEADNDASTNEAAAAGR